MDHTNDTYEFLAYVDMPAWPTGTDAPTVVSIRNAISHPDVSMAELQGRMESYRDENPYDPDTEILECIWQLKAAVVRKSGIREASIQLAEFLKASPRYSIEDADPRKVLEVFVDCPHTVRDVFLSTDP